MTAGYIEQSGGGPCHLHGRWYSHRRPRFLDRDGFLYVTGRAKAVLVPRRAQEIDAEVLERLYAVAPDPGRSAVLERDGTIVALVRPGPREAARDRRDERPRRRRIALAERARDLPSHQRLSGFALTEEPLPRTRLGKYRRFLLRDLYARALEGACTRAATTALGRLALLTNPTGAAIWSLLQARQPDHPLDLDIRSSPRPEFRFLRPGWSSP